MDDVQIGDKIKCSQQGYWVKRPQQWWKYQSDAGNKELEEATWDKFKHSSTKSNVPH